MEILTAIIQMLGGLAMFLYGIEIMGDGLKNSSGEALKRVLEKVTGNVVMGVITGALVTAVIQSSTATIVLTVALIGAGVLNLKQAVSIVMGANIGTTVTAQIIRLGSIESDGSFLLWLFDTDTLAPIALVIGIVLLMFIKSKGSKPVGDICIGFGVLFVGLNLMTSGVKPLIGTDAFTSFLGFMQNPLFGILFGLVLTVIVQSSSATVGMLQTVASVPGSGVTFSMAYPIIMGINLGTCVTTAMVCSIGSSKDAKRTGVVHIVFNTIGTVLFMIAMTILERTVMAGAAMWGMTADSGVIANFQTIFNLITAIVLVPFTNWLVKLSMIVVKEEKAEDFRHPELHTLDEKLYISPAVAVAEATKAVAAMGTVARDNFVKAFSLLQNYDEAKVAEIEADEEILWKLLDADVILTVTSVENALFYTEATGRYPIRVHVAVDTGMGRFGIRWTDTEQLKWLYSLAGFCFEGIFSHFSRSFEAEYSHTGVQLRRFLSAVNALEDAGYNVGIRHIANSCAALRFPEARLDAVRIGSGLVGRLLVPSPVMLESVRVCKARVVDLKYLQPGDTTGYGSYCVMKHGAKVAVVALGREDGFGLNTLPDRLRLRDLAAYLRSLIHVWCHPACVDFRGHKLPVLGRIGNQYTLFDATGVEIHPGDWVEWDGNLMLASCERRFI